MNGTTLLFSVPNSIGVEINAFRRVAEFAGFINQYAHAAANIQQPPHGRLPANGAQQRLNMSACLQLAAAYFAAISGVLAYSERVIFRRHGCRQPTLSTPVNGEVVAGKDSVPVF